MSTAGRIAALAAIALSFGTLVPAHAVSVAPVRASACVAPGTSIQRTAWHPGAVPFRCTRFLGTSSLARPHHAVRT